MALKPQYIVTSDIEGYYVDKTTGEPLAGGKLKFFSDINNQTPKEVFILTGSGTSPVYTSIGTEITLSAVGTPQYLGNNIVYYYFPYDGTEATTLGNIELYHIEVTNSDDVPQFTRDAWPNFTAESTTNTINVKNFIPNGQFLAHSDNPTTQVSSYGFTSSIIAQGGWKFNLTTGSAAIFANKFNRLPAGVSNLNDFPQFEFEFKCTTPDVLASVRDLQIDWPDANTFSSGSQTAEVGSQPYTLFFAANSKDSITHVFDVRLIFNYGTGGSPTGQYDASVGTVSITAGYNYHTVNNITFPSNTLAVYGTNNDSFVALALRGPNTSFDVAFTDVCLFTGNVSPLAYPPTTDAHTLSQSIAGWVPTPNPDGSDYYLPMVATPQGALFDHSVIGDVISSLSTAAYNANYPKLLCDGTPYVYANYSALGIPYYRLGDFMIANSPVANIPLYGTGLNFATAYANNGNTAILRLAVNLEGVGVAAADGTTGWSFSAITPGLTGVDFVASSYTTNTINVLGNFPTPLLGNPAGPGTSGFTVTSNGFQNSYSSPQFYSFTLLAVAASALANPGGQGKYFAFDNSTTAFIMWFQITNENSSGLPAGTKIQVNLKSTDTAQDVANIVREAINGYCSTNITVTGLPTAGQYWTFSTNPGAAINCYVWYTVAGVGTDPALANKTGIKVALAGTETNAQIVTATQLAINKYQYAVPNLQGMFLRGLEPASNWDVSLALRTSGITGISGANLSTVEYANFYNHIHAAGTLTSANIEIPFTNEALNGGSSHFDVLTGISSLSVPSGAISGSTALTGGSETRPVNAAVNFFIRY